MFSFSGTCVYIQIMIKAENKNKTFDRKNYRQMFSLSFPNFSMSKTEQFLKLPLIESFREAQEEEQMALFSSVQNANASGS